MTANAPKRPDGKSRRHVQRFPLPPSDTKLRRAVDEAVRRRKLDPTHHSLNDLFTALDGIKGFELEVKSLRRLLWAKADEPGRGGMSVSCLIGDGLRILGVWPRQLETVDEVKAAIMNGYPKTVLERLPEDTVKKIRRVRKR